VGNSPGIALLAPGAALVVHPNDVGRLGVAAVGDTVRLTSARGTVALPVRVDPATAPGTAFVPFAQDGETGVNDLIDAAAPVTEVRVETMR
jgi:assimilatory nitrate reductase catalytic subunit